MDDRIRVLYVDDEPAFLDIARLYLERMGDFKVSTSISAMEALEISDIKSCDAIVSDYLMPEMNGIAFLKVVRERFGDIPLILFTGRGREEVVIEALNEGVDSYLQKGGDLKVQFAELVHKIRHAVRRKKAEEALRESEKKYRMILENIQDVYYRLDKNGNLIMLSPSGYHLLGYDPGDNILGADPADTLYANPGDRQKILDAISEKGAVVDYEVDLRHKNGAIVTVSANSHYYYDYDGGVAGIEGIFRDITNQKRSEEELKRSENLYRTVFDNTGTATILVGPDTTILRANAGWERLTGVPRSKQENIMSWTAFIHKDDVERMKGYHYARRRDAAAAPNIYECRLVDAKKQVHSGFVHVDIIPGTGNSVASLVDVTELKQVQEKFKASEEKIRVILDHLPDLIVVHREGNILYVNPAMTDSMGWQTEEAVGQSILKFIAPEYHQEVRDAIRTRLEAGIDKPYTLELAAKDGKRRIVSVRGTVISFEGSPAIMNVLTDITTAEKAEEALRESEEKYRLLVENTNDIIYTIDLTGRITSVSPQIARYGYSAEEIVSLNLSSLILEEDLPVVLADLEETVSTGQPTTTIFRAKDKSGTIRWLEDNGVAIMDESGCVVGVSGIIRDITDRKIAEEALRESEKRYRALFENANDAITVCGLSPDGLPTSFIDVNENACRLTEFSREELLSMTPLNLDDPGTWEEGRSCIQTLMEQGHHVFERSHVRKDGTLIRVEISAHIFSLENQKLMLSIVRDITERKRADESLRESEEKFRALVETSRDMIWEIDPQGIFQYISPQVQAIMGYTPGEVIGRSLTNFAPENVKPFIIRELGRLLSRRGQLQPFEVPVRHRDGHDMVLEIRPSLTGTNRRRDGFRGVAVDITERKRTEEALRESEEKYRLLADHIQDVIWTADVNMNLTYISPSVTALRGISVEEAMEESLKDALTEESFRALTESRKLGIKAVENDGLLAKSQVMDLKFRCRDGSTIWTEVVINPIFDGNKKLVGVMGVMRDISSRRRVEEALRKANRKLNLLSSITRHDISNQLLVVDGFVDLLQNEIDDPALSDYFSRITTANSRIADMIRFTKEYENIGVEAPIWQDLADMLETIAKEILPEGITLTCDLPVGTMVFADPMLKKAFFNLLDNAVRHGERVTEIRVSSRQSGNDLVVELQDDGIGISVDDKERIFEQGFGKNTGLGLFLVREILSLTGISIKESGEEGLGARFEITVPRGVFRAVGNNNQH